MTKPTIKIKGYPWTVGYVKQILAIIPDDAEFKTCLSVHLNSIEIILPESYSFKVNTQKVARL